MDWEKNEFFCMVGRPDARKRLRADNERKCGIPTKLYADAANKTPLEQAKEIIKEKIIKSHESLRTSASELLIVVCMKPEDQEILADIYGNDKKFMDSVDLYTVQST